MFILKRKTVLLYFFGLLLCSCAGYRSPARHTWSSHLTGASFGEMSAPAQIAKRPIAQDRGIIPLTPAAAPIYMTDLEVELENNLRKPGIQIQHVGRDILIVLVRDAFIRQDSAEISDVGNTVLKSLSKILEKNNQTFIEIFGYTDAMSDQRAAGALTLDMAKRVAVYLVAHDIDPVRLFVMGRGSARPIAAQNDIGRLMNRRVEIRISPIVK